MGSGALKRLKDLVRETVSLAEEFEETLSRVEHLEGDEAEEKAHEWMRLAVSAEEAGLEPDDVRVILEQATGVDFWEKRYGPDAKPDPYHLVDAVRGDSE